MSLNLQNYTFSPGELQDKKVIFVHFPYNLIWKDELKEKFSTAKWSVPERCWYLPDSNASRKEVGLPPKTEMGKSVIIQIHTVNQAALKLGNIKSPLDDL